MLRGQRLFFLNESQSLSNFLVMDLGILQYPEYQVHRTRSVFPDRAALLAYERALQQAAALDTELEVRSPAAREVTLSLGDQQAMFSSLRWDPVPPGRFAMRAGGSIQTKDMT